MYNSLCLVCVFTALAVDTKLVRVSEIAWWANNSRYIIWYDLKNSTFQYDQRMAKYPCDVRL